MMRSSSSSAAMMLRAVASSSSSAASSATRTIVNRIVRTQHQRMFASASLSSLSSSKSARSSCAVSSSSSSRVSLRMLSTAAASSSSVASMPKRIGSDIAASVVDDHKLSTQLQSLATEARYAEAEALIAQECAAVPTGSDAHITHLKRMSKILLMQNKFTAAEGVLRDALQYQQATFMANINNTNFINTVKLLCHLVTCMRMSGVNPSDQSNLDTLIDVIYDRGLRAALVKADPTNAASALENTHVYTFICYVVGCYCDGQNYNKAKDVLKRHMLFDDVDASAPIASSSSSSTDANTYNLRELRLASGYNFLGIAEYSDHSACGGGDHSNHHHHHDHSAATKSWERALEYTRGFTDLVARTTPRGQCDDTDVLFLQAATIIRDNLSQVCMAANDVDGAIAHALATVECMRCCYDELQHDLIAAEAQLLKTYLECQRMDDAEALCDTILRSFARPLNSPETDDLELAAASAASANLDLFPSTVSLDTSRVMDELSNLMFQHSNLDYAERFLQISLGILRARLRLSDGSAVQIHPALARAYNGLGLIQIQMKAYDDAERNLKVALKMKQLLAERGDVAPPAGDSSSSTSASSLEAPEVPEAGAEGEADDGTAEFLHNLGLAQLGLGSLGSAEGNLLAAKSKYDARHAQTQSSTNGVNAAQSANYAGLCGQLAQLYKLAEKHDSALEYAMKAHEIKSNMFTSTSVQLTSEVYLIAFMLSNKLNRSYESIPYYQQLLSIVERPQGKQAPNPLSIGVALHWIANAYDKSAAPHREVAMAADAWRRSLVIIEKHMKPREQIVIQRELRRVVAELELHDEVTAIDAKIDANQKKIDDEERATSAVKAEQQRKIEDELKQNQIEDENEKKNDAGTSFSS